MINLNDRKWKQFRISNLGKIVGSHDYPKTKRVNGPMPFIGSSNKRNGITDYISRVGSKNNAIHHNVISVNRNGSVGYAFYHPYTAYFSGDVRVIDLGKRLNTFTALFITTCIRQQHHQFSYGFKLGTDRLKKLNINLPINKQGRPDWRFISNYMKQIRDNIPRSYIHNQVHYPKYNLLNKKWKQFKIQDLFGAPLSGYDLPKDKRHPGKTPFVSASGFNNGVTTFIDSKTVKKAVYKNVIGVNRTGSTGDAFYQPYKACYQGDMRILSRKGLSEYVALFLCTCIRQQKPRFAYGFQLNTLRLIKLRINLPVDKQGRPDWQFMSDYMKSMVELT